VGAVDSHLTDINRNSYVGVSKEEIRLLNLIKLILDAGWCLDSHGLLEML